MSGHLNMCKSEWEARCELAALYRLIAHFNITDIIETHISLRIEGMDEFFLINKCGTLFENVKASDFIKVSVSDEKSILWKLAWLILRG